MSPNFKASVVSSHWPVAPALERRTPFRRDGRPGQVRAETEFGAPWCPTTDYGLRTTDYHAFTLIEIMVTVGLLTLIILGLMAMFNQTQRAFRTGMTQSDVLEAGRSLTDMWQRELPEMAPALTPWTTNFIAEVAPPARLGSFAPAVIAQNLPGNQAPVQQRTNLFYDFFFMTRENQLWSGVGYLVDTPANGVGTLYRWEMRTNVFSYGYALWTLSPQFDAAARRLYSGDYSDVTNQPSTLKRVADGVVNLRVKCYAPDGSLLVPTFDPLTTNYPQYTVIYTNLALPTEIRPTDQSYFFCSNAIPAFVELEIGFLEDRTLARFRAIPDPIVRSNYLADHAANVHLFRQRIPIRNVDPTAYAVSQ